MGGSGSTGGQPGLFRRLRNFLLRPRGNPMWDGVVRGTGVVGLLGIGLVQLFPGSGPLLGLGLFTVWISGPLSPFFPVGLEPVLMVFGRLYPPWLVAVATMAAGLYVEFLSYYLYGHLAGSDRARSFRESRVVRWSRDLFERRPFFATWFCAWSPVPFWVIRILAPISDYPVGKYLVANVLGRFPKLWIFAALGPVLPVGDRVLVGVAIGGIALGICIWAYRSWRGETKSVMPRAVGSATEAGAGSDTSGEGRTGSTTVEPPARMSNGADGVDGTEGAPVRVVYIAGIGRSGSTLLGQVLGEAPGRFPAGEVMRLLGRGMVRNELCSCEEPARSCEFWGRVIRRVEDRTGIDPEEARKLARFGRRVTEGSAAPLVYAPWQPSSFRRRLGRFRRLMARIYSAIHEVSGARVLVDASKNLAWGRLLLDVPGVEVRMLHLVRDSRGVSHSFGKVRQRPGDRQGEEYMHRYPAVASSLLWNMDNLLAEYLGGRAGRYDRVRYRDFVRSPRATVERILRNGAGGDDDGPGGGRRGHDVDRFNGGLPEGRAVDVSGQHILAGNPVRFEKGPLELREDVEWREAMSTVRKGLVTLLTVPLLSRYGYDGYGGNGARGSPPEA